MPLHRIIDVIAKKAQCDPASIQSDTTLQGLGIDSLKAINILFELENEFDIEIPNEVIPELTTVQDIEATLLKLINP